jgi:hypothetical protein
MYLENKLSKLRGEVIDALKYFFSLLSKSFSKLLSCAFYEAYKGIDKNTQGCQHLFYLLNCPFVADCGKFLGYVAL